MLGRAVCLDGDATVIFVDVESQARSEAAVMRSLALLARSADLSDRSARAVAAGRAASAKAQAALRLQQDTDRDGSQ